jgi:hypothetical protein
MTRAYVVTNGCYSDYRISAVYLDADAANEHVRAMGGDDDDAWPGYRVETYEIGSWPPPAPHQAEGAVTNGEPSLPGVTFEADSTPAGTAMSWGRWGERVICTITVRAETEERARKVYSEAKAQVVADWDSLAYAAEARGEIGPPPVPREPPTTDPRHLNKLAEPGWFCTDCGRGPVGVTVAGQPERVWLESHAPSCQGTDDPEQRGGPRKYGKMT